MFNYDGSDYAQLNRVYVMKQAIRINNLEYTYPDGTQALKDINLSIFKGESVGLIGPNGAGKSTLLLHLNGILKQKGEVIVFGLSLNNGNLDRIRAKVGLVFQDPENQLFMPTVFDDVAFGPINMKLPKEEIKASVDEALTEVDMLDAINRVSHHLSFGEKKRVSIATVLSMKPDILVLDEPSANLDPAARRHLMELLKRLPITKIIAGHDLELILELCTRVVVLDNGKIVADGEARRILADSRLMQEHSLEVPLSLQHLS
ncbi:MAG: ABC transporter ATP-binding protein [Candidatus Omnitrophota bacterium]